MALQQCPNFHRQTTFSRRETNRAFYGRRRRKGRLASRRRGKLCERTHHDSGTLFVRSVFISRGESLLRFIILPAFHAAESSLRLDFIVEKLGKLGTMGLLSVVLGQKSWKLIFWRSHWRIAFYLFQFQVITFAKLWQFAEVFVCHALE